MDTPTKIYKSRPKLDLYSFSSSIPGSSLAITANGRLIGMDLDDIGPSGLWTVNVPDEICEKFSLCGTTLLVRSLGRWAAGNQHVSPACRPPGIGLLIGKD